MTTGKVGEPRTATLIKFVEEKVTVVAPYDGQIRYLDIERMHRTTNGRFIPSKIVDDVKTVVSPVHEIWNRHEFRRSALGYISEDSDDRFISETTLKEDYRTGNIVKESVAYIAYDLHSSPYLMNMFNLLLDKQHEQLKAENSRLQNSVLSLASECVLKNNQIEEIKNASFFTRLKWVFTGIK